MPPFIRPWDASLSAVRAFSLNHSHFANAKLLPVCRRTGGIHYAIWFSDVGCDWCHPRWIFIWCTAEFVLAWQSDRLDERYRMKSWRIWLHDFVIVASESHTSKILWCSLIKNIPRFVSRRERACGINGVNTSSSLTSTPPAVKNYYQIILWF